MFFKRKAPSIAGTVQPDDFKQVSESLYKQNHELAIKNKTLSLFGKLYELSVLILEPQDLANRINTTIQSIFDFELVGIFLYDEKTDTLSSLSIAESERLRKLEANFEKHLHGSAIAKARENAFFKNALKRSLSYSEDLSTVWPETLNSANLATIKAEGHIKSSLAYPLIIENKVIGVFMLSLNRTSRDIIDFEKSSLASIANIIAVALDKALLYTELRTTNEALTRSNEGQANLIHIINHQIKGYISKSRNIFSELLSEPIYGPINDKAKPIIEEGFSSLTEGVSFVQQILNASNAEKGTLTYIMNPFDYRELVQDIFNKQKEIAVKKGLDCALHVEDGPYAVNGDKLQLHEAVRNLIDNSVSYTPAGSIDITLSHHEGNALLTIKDTGVGINEEDKKHLFTKGGHGKNSIKVNVNSTGYGLSFVKGVAEAHKGAVAADSEGEGKGSTFTLSLPLQ